MTEVEAMTNLFAAAILSLSNPNETQIILGLKPRENTFDDHAEIAKRPINLTINDPRNKSLENLNETELVHIENILSVLGLDPKNLRSDRRFYNHPDNVMVKVRVKVLAECTDVGLGYMKKDAFDTPLQIPLSIFYNKLQALFGTPGRYQDTCIACKMKRESYFNCRIRFGHSHVDFNPLILGSFNDNGHFADESLVNPTVAVNSTLHSNTQMPLNPEENAVESSVNGSNNDPNTNMLKLQTEEALEISLLHSKDCTIESSANCDISLSHVNTPLSGTLSSSPITPFYDILAEESEEEVFLEGFSPTEILAKAEKLRYLAYQNVRKAEVENAQPIILSSNFIEVTFPKGEDGHYEFCYACGGGGDLILCDNCPRSCHIKCCGFNEDKVPDGDWFCHACSSRISNESSTTACPPDDPEKLLLELRYQRLGKPSHPQINTSIADVCINGACRNRDDNGRQVDAATDGSDTQNDKKAGTEDYESKNKEANENQACVPDIGNEMISNCVNKSEEQGIPTVNEENIKSKPQLKQNSCTGMEAGIDKPLQKLDDSSVDSHDNERLVCNDGGGKCNSHRNNAENEPLTNS
eukprot:CAMPEP_0194302294 /NCGR_PEP_ID=MMETSP0169-20130528/62261_1 /TAXON_ID=218684 /ORGANISM="Corethron pennatum, Strain L29A3" /LENGTH=582 /DNA_ID=CAMNT_0039052617 /DNA_START=3054 /DNA_END=4799 /DNA_ORIENTATION=-